MKSFSLLYLNNFICRVFFFPCKLWIWSDISKLELRQGDTKGSARAGDGPARRDAVGTLPGQNAQVRPYEVMIFP